MGLKPCLRCHSKNVHYLKEEHHPLHQFDGIVVCDDCELEVKCTPDQWNTRVTDPLLKEMSQIIKESLPPYNNKRRERMEGVLEKYNKDLEGL